MTIFEHNDAFISNLNKDEKKWLAYAVATMICADGVVAEEELKFLSQAIDFLDDPNDINLLVRSVKANKLPKLPCFKIADRILAFKIIRLITDVAMATTSDSMGEHEQQTLKEIGSRLGFDSTFIGEVINWGEMHQKAKRYAIALMEKSKTIPPQYKS